MSQRRLALRYLGYDEGAPLVHFTGGSVTHEVGDEFPIRARMVLGRARTADMQLCSGRVARKHCEISVHEGGLHVEDLGSTNGLQRLDDLDGEVYRELQLQVGETFSVAGCFHFQVVELSGPS